MEMFGKERLVSRERRYRVSAGRTTRLVSLFGFCIPSPVEMEAMRERNYAVIERMKQDASAAIAEMLARLGQRG